MIDPHQVVVFVIAAMLVLSLQWGWGLWFFPALFVQPMLLTRVRNQKELWANEALVGALTLALIAIDLM